MIVVRSGDWSQTLIHLHPLRYRVYSFLHNTNALIPSLDKTTNPPKACPCAVCQMPLGIVVHLYLRANGSNAGYLIVQISHNIEHISLFYIVMDPDV